MFPFTRVPFWVPIFDHPYVGSSEFGYAAAVPTSQVAIASFASQLLNLGRLLVHDMGVDQN